LASDGKWYPQRWEYNTFTTYDADNLGNAIREMVDIIDGLGQQGWELVNFTVNSQRGAGVGQGTTVNPNNLVLAGRGWTTLSVMKRPLAP
jgi:hypothetical protein